MSGCQYVHTTLKCLSLLALPADVIWQILRLQVDGADMKGWVDFVIFLDASVISHKHKRTNTQSHNTYTLKHISKDTNLLTYTQWKTHKHTNTTTSTNWLLRYDRFWGFRWIAHPRRPKLFLSYILLPQHTVNMTLSPSLNSNGHQLGSSEYVISHCPLCPVKLSTEFCMV